MDYITTALYILGVLSLFGAVLIGFVLIVTRDCDEWMPEVEDESKT